jgi:hypothetical protein
MDSAIRRYTRQFLSNTNNGMAIMESSAHERIQTADVVMDDNGEPRPRTNHSKTHRDHFEGFAALFPHAGRLYNAHPIHRDECMPLSALLGESAGIMQRR